MEKISTLGRVLYALPFAFFGINHFVMFDYYLGILTSFIPFGGYLIMFTGVIMIAASISIIFKKFIRITAITLATLLFVFIVAIHIPDMFDPETKMMGLIMLMKDTSLMGGSILIASKCSDTK
ncbi:MAG: hypothetical protein R2744_10370 [Bacteroidales bacterium]